MDKNINYIISYPRSANTFIRTCVEVITRKKTLDCNSRDDKISDINLTGTPILYKEHKIKSNLKNANKLILILRNYKDVYISNIILRMYNKKISDVDFSYNKMMEFEYNSFFDDYYNLIKFYDNFKNEKLLIYYEDLMENNIIIKNIIDFILPRNNFIINKEIIDNISKKSKNKYKKNAGIKTEKIKNLHTIFTIEQNNNIDNKFREYNPKLYDKYLDRYRKIKKNS